MKQKPRPLAYLGSLIDGTIKRRLFKDVQLYCMFFGYPGSGHSLVGSLMDAHPNMIIAHELDALGYVRRGYSKNQIFSLIMKRSAEFTREGREWTGHKYQVAGQWQGKYDQDLIVIGDKKGGWASRDILEDQQILLELKKTIQKPIRYIHVTRNPYDNISTMSRRSGRSLIEASEIYFSRAEGVRIAKSITSPDEWLDFQHEEVIDDPTIILKQLCDFLGLRCSLEYLAACTALVFPTPNKSRESQNWDSDSIRFVGDRINEYDFLNPYTYEN